MFNPIVNYVGDALKRLLTQYFDSPNFQGLLTAMIKPMQDIESTLTDMNTLRYLPNAQGAQLDIIGEIVGIKRPPGASDALYLQYIYGKIKENFSQGQPEQVIQVFQLFTGAGLVIYKEGVAGFVLSSAWVPPDQATLDNIITILQNTAPAGVRCDGIISFDATNAFAYDGNLPGAGYDDGSQTVGGKYAQLYEFLGPGFAYDGNDSTGEGYGTLFDPLAGGAYLT